MVVRYAKMMIMVARYAKSTAARTLLAVILHHRDRREDGGWLISL